MWREEMALGSPEMTRDARQALHRRVQEIRRDLGMLEARLTELGPGDRLPGLHLTLSAGGHRALLSASQVESVLPVAELRPAPGTPAAAGVATVDGRSLLAVDLASVLGHPRPAPVRGSLVVFAAPIPVTLLVDAALTASEAPEVVSSAARFNGFESDVAVARVGPELLPLVRTERILAAAGLPANLDGDDRPEVARQVSGLEVRLERRGFHICPRLRERVRGWVGGAAEELGLSAVDLFPEVLAGTPSSICAMLESATEGETYFFRHPEQFRALARLMLQSTEPGRALRIWSAGCGTGEEAYGLAALLRASGRGPGVDEVLGTDASDALLEHARQGVYGRWSFRGVAPDLEALVAPGPGVRRVPDELRAAVRLVRHDLRDPAPGEGFDAVLCRNVLPLLDPSQVAPTLQRLLGAVRPGGYLVLAPSEIPLAAAMDLESVESEGACLLRRPWAPAAGSVRKPRTEAVR